MNWHALFAHKTYGNVTLPENKYYKYFQIQKNVKGKRNIYISKLIFKGFDFEI